MGTEFDGDAFISYAHLDNIGLTEGRKGWVAHLQRALQVRVAQLLGKEVQIWWDPKGHGNDVLSETLIAQLQSVSALVSVVSPRYIRSEWCLREVTEFCKAAVLQGGVQIGDKSRLFKVLKTPVALEQQPPDLQPVLGYEFFKIDPDTGRIRELDEIFGPDAERDFWIKLDDLAHDICTLFELLGGPATVAGSAGRAVFLAETTSDLRTERDVVRRALQQQGYTVLPARGMPVAAREVVVAVAEDLERCQMSIHMLGRHYSFVPEGGTASLIEIQNDLAIERAAQGSFSRLMWIPRGLEIDDERQRRVVERLRMDPRAQHNADLLETSLQGLQTVIESWLQRVEKPSRVSSPCAVNQRIAGQLYLVYDQRDQAVVTPWADFLFERFEVVHSCFDGEEAEIRAFHEENLQNCDGVLLFHGSANQVWLRRKLAEIQKSAGYGRAKAMPEVAVCLIPPDTPDKAHFRTHLASVIVQTGGFSSEPLRPFIEALDTRTRGLERDVC
jgi:hypothetical protein